MYKEKIKAAISDAVGVLLGEDVPISEFSVEVPEMETHGDYATNIALILAKTLKRSPMEIAETLLRVHSIKNSDTWEARVASPGFINFFLKDNFLLQELNRVLSAPDLWGKHTLGEDKTVVVEYFQLNIAKRPHIGHLRSAVIGDALKRMLIFCGYHAVSDTHVGDWGTQFGILLYALKEHMKEGRENPESFFEKMAAEDPFDWLEHIYIEENKKIEANPERRELAKREFALLEQGDLENRKLWHWTVDISMKKLEENASRLGLLPFDEHRGESAYELVMPGIVAAALQKSVAKKTEDSAVVVDLSEEGLDEAVLVKADGASTYLLRDLATIQYRKEKWDFFKNLYVVDVRQSHHFRQVFRVAELLGFDGIHESEHISFGFMKLPEGSLSTRAGTAISLDRVLDEAQKRAAEIIQEKNPSLPNLQEVAEKIGVGALKYFDLSHHRASDVVFRWEEALNFEGNTGPYLQYTHARFSSILEKTGVDLTNVAGYPQMIPVERQLLMALLHFPEAIEDALKNFTPNTLSNFLFLLAQKANEFYHSCPVLQEQNQTAKNFRITLVRGVTLTLHRGLWCLGIDAPHAM